LIKQLAEPYVHDFFTGRSVLVLGSAQCVTKLDADFMEHFDFIVRCNNYKIFNSCRRVDVYYSFLGKSIKKNIDDIVADGAKFIFCRCPNADFSKHPSGQYVPGFAFDARIVYERRKDWFKLPYYIQTMENYEANYSLCNRLLTTGVSAIIDVLRYKPGLLSAAGFDFFTTPIHNVDEPCNCGGGHNFSGELHLVKKLFESKKIEVAPEMQKLFTRKDAWQWTR